MGTNQARSRDHTEKTMKDITVFSSVDAAVGAGRDGKTNTCCGPYSARTHAAAAAADCVYKASE